MLKFKQPVQLIHAIKSCGFFFVTVIKWRSNILLLALKEIYLSEHSEEEQKFTKFPNITTTHE